MAEKATIEIGRLGISRASMQKQKERRRAMQKQKRRGDFDIWEEPLSWSSIGQVSFEFDVDQSSRPYGLVASIWGDSYSIQLFGRLGLCCYNFQQGTNFKFVRWEKYTTTFTGYSYYYVTFEAMDPASPQVFSFQTMVCDEYDGEGIPLKWTTLASRIKCNEPVCDEWGDTAIDDFYKGPMPKWVSHVEADNKKYYVVQESELLENDWLHLFSEIALYSKSIYTLKALPLLEIKNVVIETKEEYTTEAREKLKAANAIFYISFNYNGDPSSRWAGDHKAIIRKTMDGGQEHMCLEVALGTEEEQLCSDYQSLYI